MAALAACPAERLHRRVLYLADYEPVPVSDWANMIQREWDVPPIKEVPLGLLQVAAKAGDGLKALGWKSPPLTSYRLNNLLTNSPQDIEWLRAQDAEEKQKETK